MTSEFETRSYLTDDCDQGDETLEVFMGGNGDWYIAIRWTGSDGLKHDRAVRLRTSGSAVPLAAVHVARLWRALPPPKEDQEDGRGWYAKANDAEYELAMRVSCLKCGAAEGQPCRRPDRPWKAHGIRIVDAVEAARGIHP